MFPGWVLLASQAGLGDTRSCSLRGTSMKITVAVDHKCKFDIGERTRERIALVKAYIEGFRHAVASCSGILDGAHLIEGEEPPAYLWRDKNWRVVYTVEKTRNLIGRRRMRISIRRVALTQ